MDFIRVKKNNRTFYGGAQSWFASNRNQSMGCGVIASANLIKNIEAKNKKDNPEFLEQSEFMALAEELAKKYIHVIPKFGVNGLFLAIGLNRYFRKHKLPYHARWGTRSSKIWDRIQEMHKEGLPVILAIGPNNLWHLKKRDLNFYVKENDEYVCRTHTRAHYVSVTGIGDDYIKISSWGNKYYVHKAEYMDYCRHTSNFLFSNIMVISKKK